MTTATSSGTATVTLHGDREIVITRDFNAPKHLVYRALTEPELVKRWWNAKRGTVTLCEIDLRVNSVEDGEHMERTLLGTTALTPGCSVVVEGGMNRPPIKRH